MIAKRYDDELMYSVMKCEGDKKYKYCTRDGKLAFKKPASAVQETLLPDSSASKYQPP